MAAVRTRGALDARRQPTAKRAARTLRRVLATAVIGVAASGAAAAHAQVYRVEPALTTAAFTVSYFGLAKQGGRFDRMAGRIVLDPDSRTGSVDFVLDGTSIRTGWALRDDFLRGALMFDVAHYPWFRFRSRRLVWDEHGLVAVDGEVTLRGVTRPVRLDVLRLACGSVAAGGREGCGAEIVGRISRSEFGMTYAYPLVGDDVDLDFGVVAVRD